MDGVVGGRGALSDSLDCGIVDNDGDESRADGSARVGPGWRAVGDGDSQSEHVYIYYGIDNFFETNRFCLESCLLV